MRKGCTPGTNIMTKGKRVTGHCKSSTSGPGPHGKWTRVETLVPGDSIIKHIVGKNTVMVHYDTTYKDQRDRRPLKVGYIALHCERMPTTFRKMALFNLEHYMDTRPNLQRSFNSCSTAMIKTKTWNETTLYFNA